MRFVFLFFLLVSVPSANAQSVEVSIGFNRLDYQTGVAYGHRWHHFYISPKVEVGITSTLAQQRFFPRLTIGTSYFLLRKGLVDFGPELAYSYSRQRLTPNAKTAHHWNEINGGYRLHVGRTIKFVQTAGCGWLNESFYSEVISDRVNFNSFGFYAQIGVSYTF